MDMCRTVWVSIQKLEQLSGRTIERNRVGSRTETVKRILSFLVGDELASQIMLNLIGVLLLVVA